MPLQLKTEVYLIIRRVFGIVDLVAGVGGLIFFLAGPYLIPGVLATEFFSSVFFITIASPLLIVVMGAVMLFPSKNGPALSLFASLLILINSLTALFSKQQPFFLAAGASADLITLFSAGTPLAAVIYFGLHGLASAVGMRLAKREPEPAQPKPAVNHPEFYCANCNTRLAPNAATCPVCKAVIRGMRCEACAFEGNTDDFKDGTCPQCGKKPG